MTDRLNIDLATSALLIMDYQTLIVERYAKDKDALLRRTSALIEAVRTAGVRVLYVVVGFRTGYPEISSRNASFSSVKHAGLFVAGDPGAEIHPAVAPKPGEIVVMKHRVSAFAGTDLDLILRANGIETLLLAGISTSGVVLSTVRHAADADYRLLLVHDCCSDSDPDVHRILVEKVLARQATTVMGADVIAALC